MTTSATTRAANAYLARGWAPTPVEARSKSPLLPGWPGRRLGRQDLGLFEGRNVGLVLGDASGGLADVDCDWPEAAELAHELLPPTGLVHGRASSRRSHWWYCSHGARNGVLRVERAARRKQTVAELRGSGLMTVVPPSTHPGGERLVWERWGQPGRVPADELRQAVGRLALAAVLRARGWNAQEAVSLVRRQAADVVKTVERDLHPLVPVRAWLGLEERSREGGRAGRSGGQLVLGCASSFTEAVLLHLGGVLGAARLLGLPLHEGRQPCPFHGGASRRSLQITGHAWRCWSGCGQGSAIHLAARAMGVDYREARAWLAAELGLRSHDHPPPARR
ncbi:MAG: bifunctional DNA primase/polymerase [Pseudomonadota bacterium]